jgi:hypothetical protein
MVQPMKLIVAKAMLKHRNAYYVVKKIADVDPH